MSKIFNKLLLCFKNRIFLLGISICLLFSLLVHQFYQLQISSHEQYVALLNQNVQRTLTLPATRGLIFDRNGNLLATNRPAYTLYYDLQIDESPKERHEHLLALSQLLNEHGNALLDEVPISKDPPFIYTANQSEVKQFLYTIPYDSVLVRQELSTYSAAELVTYLQKQFQIDSHYSEKEVRTLIGIECLLYNYQYKSYEPVKMTDDISADLVTCIEEQKKSFPNVRVVVEAKRYYPYGVSLSSVLGYTGSMRKSQYEELEDKGYCLTDDVGQMGIESQMEEVLRGVNGEETIEINERGQKVNTLEIKEAIAGDDLYLSLDVTLQKAAYDSLEKELSKALIERLMLEETPLTSQEVIYSLVDCGGLQMEQMEQAEETSYQYELYNQLFTAYEQMDELIAKSLSLKEILLSWIQSDKENVQQMVLLALDEQQFIKLTNQERLALASGEGVIKEIIIALLERGSLKPSALDIDPCSGAVVVVDVNSGEVLGLVSYPSYDNNQMVSHFNTYWRQISQDSRSLLWNRALKTLKAPGSIFKMITSIAGLEEGVITPEELIVDEGTYKEAGLPYPKCWVAHTGTHGAINLETALAVSCNYYFYEVAMRLNAISETTFGGADKLAEYAQKFGLASKTGIELEESSPNLSVPYDALTNELSKRFLVYCNESQTDRQRRIDDVTYLCKKGIINKLPIEVGLEEEELSFYEIMLGEAVETIIQQELQDHYLAILESCYAQLEELLQSSQQLVGSWVEQALAQEEDLETTIKGYLSMYMEENLGEQIDVLLQESLADLNTNLILEAYDDTYTKLYRNLIRDESTYAQGKALQKVIKELPSYYDTYLSQIRLKIRQNMINLIVNNLLDGVKLSWSDGLTVRSGIGQGNNAFTPVQMARYIAAFASEDTLPQLSLVKGYYDYESSSYIPNTRQGQPILGIKPETIETVKEGMLAVTTHELGTAKDKFKDLNVKVGAKTGTAEEGQHAHSWFVGFAPYEEPEIAVIVTLYNTDDLGGYSQNIAYDVLNTYFN